MPAENNKSLRRCKYFIRLFRLGDFSNIVARIGSGLDRLNSISSTMVDVLQVSK